MRSLYEDPHFTFRFDETRKVRRFHLAGVGAGRRVTVFQIDPASGVRLGLLGEATTGPEGWVELPGPIVVRAGEAFIAVLAWVIPECEGVASPPCEAPPGFWGETDPPTPQSPPGVGG